MTPPLRVATPEDASAGAEALAHLLAVLDNAERVLHECMFDVDARILAAHRAQLARGREWPGDEIRSPIDFEHEPEPDRIFLTTEADLAEHHVPR